MRPLVLSSTLSQIWELPFPLGKEATRQAVRQAPPRTLLTFPWVKEAVLPSRQSGRFSPSLLWKETVLPQQAVRQALSFPLGKEAALPRQLLTFLPGKGSNVSPAGSQAGALLPSRKEAVLLQQAVRQVLSFPLGKEAALPRQLLTFLPGRKQCLPSR